MLKKVKTIPKHLNPKKLETYIWKFVEESDITFSLKSVTGIVAQTIENIVAALLDKTDTRHLWLYIQDNQILGYVLSYIGREADGSNSFWITQAYADPRIRRTKGIKRSIKTLREEAKKQNCKHLIIPASRNPKVYKRFFGYNLQPYLTLLKEDL